MIDVRGEATRVAIIGAGYWGTNYVRIFGKHVLVEKPLATTSKDASELVDLAEKHGRTLMVGHTFLYNPGIRAMKEYVAAGDVGDVYYLYSQRTSLGPIRTDVNAIWDLAPHDIAILNYLLGLTPTWVSAVGANPVRHGLEDVGFITLGYPGDVIGHVHVSWADPNKVRKVVVVGSEKRVVFNDMDPLERVRVFDKGVKQVDDSSAARYGEHTLQLRDGPIMSPPIPAIEPLKNQCGAFIHAIRGRETPVTDGAQGYEVVRILEAVDRSVARHGVPENVSVADQTSFVPETDEFEEASSELSRAVR